jgi:serine protease Do
MRYVGHAAARLRTALALAVVAAMLAAPATHAQEMMLTQAGLVRSLLPTVVNITARAEIGAPTEEVAASAADAQQHFEVRVNAGSGFVIKPEGVIVTNWHVVDGAYEIVVTFSDGDRAKAQVLNAARLIDIALLKVDVGHPLAAVHWADSGKVQIGDPVLAIGNPLGVGLSVTAGIVSALNRNIMDTPYDDFIQTDAPINHGNSGGPLFNTRGEVIGINTALISPTSASAGLGFAIPANDAHLVINRLLDYGWVRPGWLGVKIQQVTPDMAAALGMPEPEGSIVAWVVDGGPAAKSGVQVGDVILRFGSKVPTDDRDLLRLIAASAPGEKVTLLVLRHGQQIELPVALAEWPKMQWEERDAPTKAVQPHWVIPPNLGISVQPPPPDYLTKNAFPASAKELKAVQVSGIQRDTEAARRGLGVGDLILRIDDVPIGSAADMQQQIDRARAAHHDFALFLIVPKTAVEKGSKFPGPKWIALRVLPG